MLEWFSAQLFWAGQEGSFNAETYCQFLAQNLGKTQRRLIIIHDGAPCHRAAYTKQWLSQHAARVTVYALPSYSTDYNPIEQVWRYVKEGTHNSYFAVFRDLAARVEERLEQLQAKPARVQQLRGTPWDDVTGVPARAA